MANVAESVPTSGLVLDLDPDLGYGIPADEWELARHHCRDRMAYIRRGPWTPTEEDWALEHPVGLVIHSGLLCREIALADNYMLELLGPGDVVQIPSPPRHRTLGSDVRLTAAIDTRLIVLGESFVRAATRWPCLLSTVQARLEEQRQRLAIQGLIAHVPRADNRVLLTMRHLADSWGRVTPEGTLVPFALTHELLGRLIGARRPTVTVAVRALEDEQLLRRTPDGSWVLTAAGAHRVERLTHTRETAAALGESFMLRQRVVRTRLESVALRAEAKQMRVSSTDGRTSRFPGRADDGDR